MMHLRGRSRDRSRKVTPPGPSYMTNEQFADYLADLRNNRVQRPNGARPQPSSSRRESDRVLIAQSCRERTSTDLPPRSASALSHNRAQSIVSSGNSRTGRSRLQYQSMDAPIAPLKPSQVVPSATYIERGQRWMEKEEAVSLREAMEDMDLKQEDDEARLREAAQMEASELIWQHQNPQAVNPDAPYSYKDHLKKNSYAHARTQSIGRYGGIGIATGLARDFLPRSISGGSTNSWGMHSQRSRVSSGSSDRSHSDDNMSPRLVNHPTLDSSGDGQSSLMYTGITSAPRPCESSRRRSNARRNISGEIINEVFTGDQIFEEPERESMDRGRRIDSQDIPAPLRIKPRNPLNRVQFAADLPGRSSSTPPEPTKKISRTEIHRNPPSQSKNGEYTSNNKSLPSVPQEEARRDSLEIRSDDIRQATSMRLKYRSPKLPTPSAVSDKPGRPIVSFDANWKPKEADEKPEERKRSFIGSRALNKERQSLPSRPDTETAAPIPTIQLPDTPTIQVNEIPSISVSEAAPAHPVVSRPDPPRLSISAPAVPVISVSEPSQPESKRPLPDPKHSARRPPPRHHATLPLPRGHWSPAASSRATATCHQCQLLIEGRVVALRGISQRFHPECFICFCCGTGLEALEISPEPEPKRNERLDRIRRRNEGEVLEEIDGQTMADDGDERLRFYCHLDWHENFAPRCKHCKTPIIGEHAVALGEHWHYGHFFCAECGDPFEQGMTHIEKDGYAWCLKCQTQRTERRAPKCMKCKRPVIGQYVQALGGEWHDECFRCATCKGGFNDGQIFPKEVGGEMVVLCTRCMERELKA